MHACCIPGCHHRQLFRSRFCASSLTCFIAEKIATFSAPRQGVSAALQKASSQKALCSWFYPDDPNYVEALPSGLAVHRAMQSEFWHCAIRIVNAASLNMIASYVLLLVSLTVLSIVHIGRIVYMRTTGLGKEDSGIGSASVPSSGDFRRPSVFASSSHKIGILLISEIQLMAHCRI